MDNSSVNTSSTLPTHWHHIVRLGEQRDLQHHVQLWEKAWRKTWYSCDYYEMLVDEWSFGKAIEIIKVIETKVFKFPVYFLFNYELFPKNLKCI